MGRTAAQEILHNIALYLRTNPEIRFCQALFNLGILEQQLGMDMKPHIVDPHHLPDDKTLAIVKSKMRGTYHLKPLPDYGAMMPIAEFTDLCTETWFLNRDGHGQYATISEISDIWAYPADIVSGDLDPRIDNKLTHIIWFSK